MRRHRPARSHPLPGIPCSYFCVQSHGAGRGRNPWDSGDRGLTLRGPHLHNALGCSLLGPRAGLYHLVAAAWLAEHVWGLQCRLPLRSQIQILLGQVRAQLPDLKLQEAEGLRVGALLGWGKDGVGTGVATLLGALHLDGILGCRDRRAEHPKAGRCIPQCALTNTKHIGTFNEQ